MLVEIFHRGQRVASHVLGRGGSTILTSQLPVEHWHEAVGDPTLAEIILDRLAHNAHPLALSGESVRKRNGLTKTLDPASQDWLYATDGQNSPLP